jgi:ATP-dependent Clp protease protease subunit
MLSDFQKYSGINPLTLQGYISKGFQSPTVIQERKSNIAPIDIFSCLMQNRIIFLGDPIDSEVANIVAAQLIYLDAVSKDDITFYINCPGGNVTDGLVIYDTMQAVKADVNTVCIGMAASMASILLVAGTKGKRKILPNGRVLIHQPWGVASGTADDITIETEQINKDKLNLYSILSQHTGQDLSKIIGDSKRDFWLDSEGALNYGCVDEIVKTIK